MKPTIAMHRIAQLKLSPIVHIRPPHGQPDFWTRDFVTQDRDGGRFVVTLFADTPDGLMTPEEKREAREQAEMDKYLEAVGLTEVGIKHAGQPPF